VVPQDTLERLFIRRQRDELHEPRRLRGGHPAHEPDWQYRRPAQRAVLRTLHRAEYVRRRRGRRARIYRTWPQYQLHNRKRARARQPDRAEPDRSCQWPTRGRLDQLLEYWKEERRGGR
jgi:hypothetical protein